MDRKESRCMTSLEDRVGKESSVLRERREMVEVEP
jgi:hypothetical protein